MASPAAGRLPRPSVSYPGAATSDAQGRDNTSIGNCGNTLQHDNPCEAAVRRLVPVLTRYHQSKCQKLQFPLTYLMDDGSGVRWPLVRHAAFHTGNNNKRAPNTKISEVLFRSHAEWCITQRSLAFDLRFDADGFTEKVHFVKILMALGNDTSVMVKRCDRQFLVTLLHSA
jgi:hypothetical protein